MEEVQSGALEGPLSLDDIPCHYPLSRRFGIKQGAKIRCIDDFSMTSVNASVQSTESPKPQTLDVFAALCVYVMSSCDSNDVWQGRTFDLVRAYRQCAVRPSSKMFSHIVVQRPGTKEIAAFRMKALPFGAVRSVHSFLRFAFNIWYLLVKELMVLTANYFDDFVTLAIRHRSRRRLLHASICSCVFWVGLLLKVAPRHLTFIPCFKPGGSM